MKFSLAKTCCRLSYLLVIIFVNYNFPNLARFSSWSFAVVEKCKYKNNIVALKKLHSNLPQNVTKKFTKETLLLWRKSSRNVVKIPGVCAYHEINIMIEYFVFCTICGALRDLVTFAQFKKREKHPWRSFNFSNIADFKLALHHGCFSRILNCVNGTKSRNAPLIW